MYEVHQRENRGHQSADKFDQARAHQIADAFDIALKQDKMRSNIHKISELGLVEMTRKRVRQDLRALLSVQCPTCRGAGVTKSDETLAAEVFRAVRAKVATESEPLARREVVARVHPELATYLEGEARADLTQLETALDVKIVVQTADRQAHRDDFEVRVR